MRRLLSSLVAICLAGTAWAGMPNVTLPSIDGGDLSMRDWDGQPVLVVNTASRCAFTDQYADLQTLYDTYRDQGLVVLAVPSDDFNQELGSAEEVKEFCEMTFGLDLPMTDIVSVTGSDAHPLYVEIKAQTGFAPRWNFNKVLFDPNGDVVATWRSSTRPLSRPMRDAIEATLAQD
ncbi:MAG: glutathione peroxidase [Pseudomonadota bacterium]